MVKERESVGLGEFDEPAVFEPTDNELKQSELCSEELSEINSTLSSEASDTEDPTKLYLREIGSIPLLSREEELALAITIDQGKKAAEEIARGNLDEEFQQLAQNNITLGEQAKTKMIESNLRLVVSVAKKYMGNGLPLLDMIQEGNTGLMRAIDKFDYRKGYKLSTYAHWWIKQAITRGIMDQSRTIRLPAHIYGSLNQITQVENILAEEGFQNQTDAQLSELTGLSLETVKAIRNTAKTPISLDSPGGGAEENSPLWQLLPNQSSKSVEDEVFPPFLRDALEEAMVPLTNAQRKILELRNGWDNDGETLTLNEIGKKLGISREAVRQAEVKGLDKIRRSPSRLNNLRDYLD